MMAVVSRVACVAVVSVWFRNKEDRGGGFSVLTAREMKRELKNKRGERGRGGKKTRFLPLIPTPPRSLTCAIFGAVFDSRSSFFAHRPHRNA